MSTPGWGDLSVEDIRLLDDLCDRFEAALRRGQRPDPDHYLREAPAHLGERLRGELDVLRRAYLHGATEPNPAHGGGAPVPFGDYELLAHLGRGGMGEVYQARQVGADRLVALKIVRRDRLDALTPSRRAEWLAQFRREARAAARVEHPGVVTVYQVGEHAGEPFYSMRYVPGQSLADLLAAGPLEPRRAAELFEAIARAVHHAHRCGVLHRDLKPRNILLDPEGRPFVTDFGLAGWLFADTEEADDAAALAGSPPYLAPEQIEEGRRIDARTDVYGLGATLYHALTGRPLFVGDSAASLLRQVLFAEPAPPSRWRPELPRNLETVCLKCLAKEPAQRYPSAEALADDLRHCLDNATLDTPRPPWRRAARQMRRHVIGVGLLAVCVAALLGLLAGAWWHVERVGEADERIADAGQKLSEADRERARLAHITHEQAQVVRAEKERAARAIAQRTEAERRERAARARRLSSAQAEFAKLLDRLTDERLDFKPAADRRALLEDAVGKQAVLAALTGDVADRAAAASGQRLLGIYQALTGRFDAAESSLRRALDMLDTLPDHSLSAERERAIVCEQLSRLLARRGIVSAAEDLQRRAITLRRHLLRADAGPSARLALAASLVALADILRAVETESFTARPLYDDARALLEDQLTAHPGDLDAELALLHTLGRLGELLLAEHHWQSAAEAFALQARRAAPFLGMAAEGPLFQRSYSRALLGYAAAKHELGDTAEERQALGAAKEELLGLKWLYPGRTDCRTDLADACARLGALSEATGRLGEASESYQRAISLREELTRDVPGDPTHRHELTRLHLRLARLRTAPATESPPRPGKRR